MSEGKEKNPLETVFSGALMLVFGFVLGGVFSLGNKVILARFLDPSLYGVFSQSTALLYALVMVSMAGLNAGSSRFISHNLEKKERAATATATSLLVVIPLSVLVFGLLYLLSDPVSSMLFHDARSASVLRMFSIAGPSMAINSIIISGFRGFQSSKERVALLDFIIPILQVLGIGTAILLGYGIQGAATGYALSFVLAMFVAVYWYRKSYVFTPNLDILRELVEFSWPIMISSVAVQIFLWSPPLLVGMLSDSTNVGYLNAALPLAASTKMFLTSVSFLFMPVIAELHSKDSLDELHHTYSSATRWIIYLSTPILGFFIFAAGDSTGFVFGPDYFTAGTGLLILSLGFMVNMATGPIGELLIAVGLTKREMLANIVKLGITIILSWLLVPEYGFVAGAASYAAGMSIGNILRVIFGREYVSFDNWKAFTKPFIALVSGGIVIYLSSGLFLPFRVIGYGLIYLAVFTGLKPLEQSDVELIEHLLERQELPYGNKLMSLARLLAA
ncbi:MAG: flippase [Candidatus Nanohaloarchaea archaeon]